MYTIKAIRKDNGQWINGYIWNGASCAYVIPHNLGVNHENNQLMATAYEVHKETICKPIGIDAYWYDKNGGHIIPVYENDIVRFEINKATYEGRIVKQFNKYVIELTNIENEFVELSEIRGEHSNIIRCQIIGNKHDLVEGVLTAVEPINNSMDTSEECPHFEAQETDYDVLSGHSSYKHYCNKNGRKEIIKCVHCTRCKRKGESN